ncbi:hypothetical protein [Streptomyces sp. AM6-12]|uniref:hypothetical protein n=1 Tax=Streptomyces sp. AM6-12 TaxID=3345149 RepID=UPI00378C92BB
MQGHGHGQPATKPPHPAVLVLLRVLFVAIGFLSVGFLSWAMLLRLAAVTRRVLDWWLFAAAMTADVVSFALVGSDPSDDASGARGTGGMCLVLITLVAVTTYYLIAEIRHYARRRGEFEARPIPAYGYPRPAASPYPTPAAPVLSGLPTPPPTAPHTPVPGPPPVVPPPHRPAPARIDQVRAELDELSDYLRKHDGRPDERHTDGSGR